MSRAPQRRMRYCEDPTIFSDIVLNSAKDEIFIFVGNCSHLHEVDLNLDFRGLVLGWCIRWNTADLEDFQFDLENMLTMSQLVGKSAEERNAASEMLDILASTKNRTAAEVAAEVVTDAAKVRDKKVLHAVLAANTAGRARMIVREDNTKNGARAWARLRERFGRDSGATSFTEVFQYGWPSEKPFDDVWRDCVKKVSKLPSGSLSSQAIEKLTISGLSRHGQPELENPLRLRGKTFRLRSTICGQQSPQPMNAHQCCVDRCKMQELWKPNTSETGLLVQGCDMQDLWQTITLGTVL